MLSTPHPAEPSKIAHTLLAETVAQPHPGVPHPQATAVSVSVREGGASGATLRCARWRVVVGTP